MHERDTSLVSVSSRFVVRKKREKHDHRLKQGRKTVRKMMLMRILFSLLFYDVRKRWAGGSLLYPSNETRRLEAHDKVFATRSWYPKICSVYSFCPGTLCRWLFLSDSVPFPRDFIIIYDVNAATHTKLVCWTNPLTQTWSRRKNKKTNFLQILHEHENEGKEREWHVVHGKHQP